MLTAEVDFPSYVWVAGRDDRPEKSADVQPEEEPNAEWQIEETRRLAQKAMRDYFAIELGHEFKRFNCGWDFELRQRETDKGVFDRYAFFGCNERGACPHCAIGYGRAKGLSLYSLMLECIGTRETPPEHGDALVYSLIATLPKEISRRLGAAMDRREIPPQIAKLRTTWKKIVAKHLFQCREKGLLMAVNTHMTSSEHPLSGYNVHFHTMIPNVTGDNRELTAYREIPKHRFAALKLAWFKALKRMFPKEMKAWCAKMKVDEPHLKLNFETHFVPNTPEGRVKLKHHCLYDARHMMQDLRDYIIKCDNPEKSEKPVGVWNKPEEMTWFLELSEFLQGRKTRTFYGALTPGKRKEIGVSDKQRKEENDWIVPANSYRQLVRFTERGAVFRKHLGGEMYEEEEVDASQIELHDMSQVKRYQNVYNIPGMEVTKVVRRLRLAYGDLRRRKVGREAIAQLEEAAPGFPTALKDFFDSWNAVDFLLSPKLVKLFERRTKGKFDYRVPGLRSVLEPRMSGLSAIWFYHDPRQPCVLNAFDTEAKEHARLPETVPRARAHMEAEGFAPGTPN